MIDWWLLARHSVWIAGAAIVVAAWSVHRRLISPASFVGVTLFCLGMASVSRWWEAPLWIGIPCLLRWHRR